MADENALLIEISDLFPTIGMVVPYIEIKFRLSGKHGQDFVDATLHKLVESETMSRFEFNNQIHYKSKEDIPMSLGGKPKSNPSGGSNNSSQLEDLSKILFAISETLNNSEINEMVQKYKSKY